MKRGTRITDTRTIRQALKLARYGVQKPVQIKNPYKYLHSSSSKRLANALGINPTNN